MRSNDHAVIATINAAGVTSGPAVTAENVRDALPGVKVGFLQEVGSLVRRRSLDDELPDLLGVHQDARDAAHAGSALVWDKSSVQVGARGFAVGARPDGDDDMRTRYLAWANMRMRNGSGGLLAFRAIAGHRPAPRDRDEWPEFDKNLAHLIGREGAGSALPAIVGIDSNTHDVERMLAAIEVHGGPAMKWVGVGIDGFIVDARLTVSMVRALDRTRSDHRPVAGLLRVRPVHVK